MFYVQFFSHGLVYSVLAFLSNISWCSIDFFLGEDILFSYNLYIFTLAQCFLVLRVLCPAMTLIFYLYFYVFWILCNCFRDTSVSRFFCFFGSLWNLIIILYLKRVLMEIYTREVLSNLYLFLYLSLSTGLSFHFSF